MLVRMRPLSFVVIVRDNAGRMVICKGMPQPHHADGMKMEGPRSSSDALKMSVAASPVNCMIIE